MELTLLLASPSPNQNVRYSIDIQDRVIVFTITNPSFALGTAVISQPHAELLISNIDTLVTIAGFTGDINGSSVTLIDDNSFLYSYGLITIPKGVTYTRTPLGRTQGT